MTRLGLRPLRWDDAWFCWRLAHDPEVRRLSADPRPPTLLGHWRWMRRHLDGGPAHALIVLVNGRRAGVETLKVYRDGFAIGIAFRAEHRGKGYGVYVLRTARLAGQVMGRRLYALIKPDNGPSRQVFTKAGFLPIGTTDDALLLYSTHAVMVGVPSRAVLPCS